MVPSPLAWEALDVAGLQVGVRETAPNRGPEVDGYLLSVGLDPAAGCWPWCAAFVHWCYWQASVNLGCKNNLPVSASALHLYEKCPPEWRSKEPFVGALFFVDHGHGKGHVGFVEHLDPQTASVGTVEGNTNDGGSREGDGVYRRMRKTADIMGYVVLSQPFGDRLS